MKSVPWYRKSFKKARYKKAAKRVDYWVISCKTGMAEYYVTNDGKRHKPNNLKWKVLLDAPRTKADHLVLPTRNCCRCQEGS